MNCCEQETLISRLFQPLYAFEITLTFLDTIFIGFWRRISIASLIDSLVEEMWWKMTRLLDTEWERNGVPKKGLADNTFKMPTSNKNVGMEKSLLWGEETDFANLCSCTSTGGQCHDCMWVLHENVNTSRWLSQLFGSIHANAAPTINMLNSIKAWYCFNKRKSLRLN